MAIIKKSEHGKINLVSDSNEFFLLAEDTLLAGARRQGDALVTEMLREGDGSNNEPVGIRKKPLKRGLFFIP
ncbi:MAG TPA: hypothetical protein VFG46_19160 [Chryseolinea sp.]|nr:hypothetical protein [Chryseolinea sp.]